MITPQAENKIQAPLAMRYPVLNTGKMDDCLWSLNYMRNFYDSKIVEAPPKQANMFKTFCIALTYAETVLKEYDKLTIELKGRAKK